MEGYVPDFDNKDEEILFWRDLASQCQQELEEVKEEMRQKEREAEEFQESSHQLEKEYETSLEQSEHTIRELRTRLNRLQLDNDSLREKLDQFQKTTNSLQDELSEHKSNQDKLIKFIRELEQKNDDLERAQRVINATVGDLESKLNNQLERNALLESETDEASALVQRLKDEKRDLTQELRVRLSHHKIDKEKRFGNVDSNKLQVEMETQTSGSPLKKFYMNEALRKQLIVTGLNGDVNTSLPLTEPTRISAINIVGDILRRVGGLESKLTSCRNLRESPQPGDTRDPFRARRIPRGTTASPSMHSYVRS